MLLYTWEASGYEIVDISVHMSETFTQRDKTYEHRVVRAQIALMTEDLVKGIIDSDLMMLNMYSNQRSDRHQN